MKFFDYIRFALKNIWRQKLRTVLTIFAIVIGATSVIAMLALVFGAKSVFLSQIESSGILTQVTVTSSTDVESNDVFGGGGGGGDSTGKKLDDTLVAKIKTIEHVTSVSPTVYVYQLSKVQLKDGDGKQYNVQQIIGYVPSQYNQKDLLAGRNLTSEDKAGKVVLGHTYASKMGYKDKAQELIGKKLILTTQKGYQGEGAELLKPPTNGEVGKEFWEAQQERITQLEAEVVGITNPGMDEGSSYVTLEWARAMSTYKRWEQKKSEPEQQQPQIGNNNRAPSTPPPVEYILTSESDFDRRGYQALEVKVDSVNNVEKVAEEVRKEGVGAVTAKQFLETVLKTLSIIGIILGAIGAISLGVAAIGVINTMVMATLERTREIGVMRACGATRAAVRRLFTFEASFLGFWGGVFGVLVGYGLAQLTNTFAGRLIAEQNLGVTNIISIPWWLNLSVIGVTTLIGMLAGLYPAIRAARMNPVEALRYE